MSYIHLYRHRHFEWDLEKSQANLADRGFDFEFATLVFESSTLEVQDRRQDYGEVRIVAIGIAQDITLTVVYTDRRDESGDIVRRIISGRRSNRREREAYQAAVQDSASPRARGPFADPPDE